MGAHIPIPQDKIEQFCHKHHIRSLALFGSVLREDFRPDSDVDVLVEFEPDANISIFDFLHMREELETLFARKVDLIESSALRNPFRRHEILRTKQILYAA